jgi:hypothetical protein
MHAQVPNKKPTLALPSRAARPGPNKTRALVEDPGLVQQVMHPDASRLRAPHMHMGRGPSSCVLASATCRW